MNRFWLRQLFPVNFLLPVSSVSVQSVCQCGLNVLSWKCTKAMANWEGMTRWRLIKQQPLLRLIRIRNIVIFIISHWIGSHWVGSDPIAWIHVKTQTTWRLVHYPDWEHFWQHRNKCRHKENIINPPQRQMKDKHKNISAHKPSPLHLSIWKRPTQPLLLGVLMHAYYDQPPRHRGDFVIMFIIIDCAITPVIT